MLGAIALVSRGTCEFGLKSVLAGNAGAIGVIIYNNVDGPYAGTLGSATRPEGDYPPTVSLSKADGLAILAGITSATTGKLTVLLSETTT